MVGGCICADVQMFADVVVAQSGRQEAQHIHLATGQTVRSISLLDRVQDVGDTTQPNRFGQPARFPGPLEMSARLLSDGALRYDPFVSCPSDGGEAFEIAVVVENHEVRRQRGG